MLSKRYESIDILKGIAMIMVILVHYNQSFVHGVRFFMFGQMGCQIFFVLSGFGVAASFAKKTRESAEPFVAAKQFYYARFKALAPGYWLMIFVFWALNLIALRLTSDTIGFSANRNLADIFCNVFLSLQYYFTLLKFCYAWRLVYRNACVIVLDNPLFVFKIAKSKT